MTAYYTSHMYIFVNVNMIQPNRKVPPLEPNTCTDRIYDEHVKTEAKSEHIQSHGPAHPLSL